MENTGDILLGLVLCGGKSSRMGQDKGQLTKDHSIWAEHMGHLLRSVGLATYFSIHPSQFEAYQHIFPSEILIPDQVDIKGPLAGLLSAHRLFPKADIFVLPCDMIDMEAHLLERLIDIRRQIVQADVYLYIRHGQVEPLCAIYTASGLHKLYADYQSGGLTNFSMKRAIQNLRSVKVPAPENAADFRNYNTPEDIVKWQKAPL